MTDRNNELRIEPISRSYRRKGFNCENPSLNDYLHQFARQNDKHNIAKTFVAVDDKSNVYGYFCLSATSIEFEELTDELSRQLPGYPVPACLIGKLAVDVNHKGKGLGARLLVEAFQQILTASEAMAVKAIVVDAIDEQAKHFYKHFGFLELTGHKLKLFLPIETIGKAFI
jgi:predicted N-acetyltransferase YhbS